MVVCFEHSFGRIFPTLWDIPRNSGRFFPFLRSNDFFECSGIKILMIILLLLSVLDLQIPTKLLRTVKGCDDVIGFDDI
jgi:hypothetical protein